MELKKIDNDYYATWEKQGNNRNGNPIFIVNIFQKLSDDNFWNVNIKTGARLDKYDNIKLSSYNIEDSIRNLIQIIKEK